MSNVGASLDTNCADILSEHDGARNTIMEGLHCFLRVSCPFLSPLHVIVIVIRGILGRNQDDHGLYGC